MEKGNYPTDLDSLFRIIDEEICCSEDSKKPLIGITTYTKEGASSETSRCGFVSGLLGDCSVTYGFFKANSDLWNL